MSIQTAPKFRLDTVRTHLHQARAYQDASTPAELFADALLDQFKAAVAGARVNGLTPQQVADAFEAAEKAAKLAAEMAVCGCGHRWADHVGRAGCLECDGCRERRPRLTAKAGAR